MMSIEAMLKKIPVLSVTGDRKIYFDDIQYDSRKIRKGAAFVAIRGFHVDGHRFAQSAYDSGARVFFVEDKIQFPDATVVQVSDTRVLLSEIARVFFNYPDKKMKIVGITGTNGKTTTAYLLYSIFKQAHWRPGLITTVEYFDGEEFRRAERTTPESLDLIRLFSQMVNHHLKSVVMEASSHALSLHRVDGIPFVAGVFTNLGRDHLDFHKTMEDYFQAKFKLFARFSEFQKAILNLDDSYSRRIMKSTSGEVFTYSLTDKSAMVHHLSHFMDSKGMQVKFAIPSGEMIVQIALIGEYNIYNIMAAITAALSLGINENFITEGINQVINIPGRCEKYRSISGTNIYLDYAHTPDALKGILRAIWSTKPKNLIVVFGAGGDRDKGKRPEMGKAAGEYADTIILTNDNPRNEDPERIIDEIFSGISDHHKVQIIPDRKEAILTALKQAGSKDSVLIAGKGHEDYQEIGERKIPFDDHKIIEEFLMATGKN
jgi:UDP-N-acetylmuramoyl-L-alanyl-D-glutamate--2,6-diaminopimelate ligase